MFIPSLGTLQEESALSIFWFRRDLRLEDNHGLYKALQSGHPVLPLFIFDSEILSDLDNKKDLRVQFIHQEITRLKHAIQKHNSSLLVCYGEPASVYRHVLEKLDITAVYTNEDYEPYAVSRDRAVRKVLIDKHVSFKRYKDQVIFAKDEVAKQNGEPYRVFSPYMKTWKRRFRKDHARSYASEKKLSNFVQVRSLNMLSLDDIGFSAQKFRFPARKIVSSTLKNYDQERDIPSAEGTTRLGIHLRFGTVSIRAATRAALRHSSTWLNELIWRNFFMTVLWHFPHAAEGAFKPAYENIAWENDEDAFEAWCSGRTGYPLVDAGMRQLNQTGYMHNRLRMVTASFLAKHLLIDWRWGEAYFASKLLDYELSSNNGGWQWAAGIGCDAQPYFRIFNPEAQTKKFDPQRKYIAQWVPEYKTERYPKPIVDHKSARERCKSVYKAALDKKK